MLLNLTPVRLRKKKLRRRRFIYKPFCPVNKRRIKFRRVKRQILRHTTPRSLKKRFVIRTLRRFRRARFVRKRRQWGILRSFKPLRHLTFERPLESDILFSYWVGSPHLSTIKPGKTLGFVKKLLFWPQLNLLSVKSQQATFFDPFYLQYQLLQQNLQIFSATYTRLLYNLVSYTDFNVLNSYVSITKVQQHGLLYNKLTPLTLQQGQSSHSSPVQSLRWSQFQSFALNSLKIVQFLSRLYPRRPRGYFPSPRRPAWLFTKRYYEKLHTRASLLQPLKKANHAQVSSYFVSFNHFMTSYVLQIKEKDAIYRMNGFKAAPFNPKRSVAGTRGSWLFSTNDTYFETLADFNPTTSVTAPEGKRVNLQTKLLVKAPLKAWKRKLRRKKRRKLFKKHVVSPYGVTQSISRSLAARRKLFHHRGSKFLGSDLLSNRSPKITTLVPQPTSHHWNFVNLNSKANLLFSHDLTPTILSNQVLYKYLSFNYTDLNARTAMRDTHLLLKSLGGDLSQLHFNARVGAYASSNLLPAHMFQFTIRRRLLKLFKFYKFNVNIVMWYYTMLIRFMENCSGKKVCLKFNPFIENLLPFSDLARASMWAPRVVGFQRLLGPKIFVNESLRIFHLAIRSKDPTFLANWIKGMLQRMSFWKYRLLFRYIKFVMRYLFWIYFSDLGFKGLKLRLKGKISVAGNARTRTLLYQIGETSYSTFANRIASDYSTINTFTGVLGFRLWFFF